MRDHHEAEVLVQEAFIKAFKYLGDLGDGGKFASWIMAIARRLSVDMHRERQKHSRNISLSSMSGVSNLLHDAAILADRQAGQRVENGDLEARLHVAIAELPDSERSTLHLQLAGMNYEKIAQELDISPAAVKGRLARARKKVKALMKKSDGFTS